MQFDVPNAKQQDCITSKTVHVIINSKPEIIHFNKDYKKRNPNWNPTSLHHITMQEKRNIMIVFEPHSKTWPGTVKKLFHPYVLFGNKYDNWLTNTLLSVF